MIHDFADLVEHIKTLNDETKKTITVNRDEGIVRVLEGSEFIFSADEVNFVHAFFILNGVDIDENEESRVY